MKISSQGSAETDLLWFVGLLVLLFILWIATGGPQDWEATAGPFIEPPSPLGTGEVYGPDGRRTNYQTTYLSNPTYANDTSSTINYPEPRSPYVGLVSLQHGNEQYSNRSGEEYVVIVSDFSNTVPVNITGWRLMNGKNRRGGISDVVTIPFGVQAFLR